MSKIKGIGMAIRGIGKALSSKKPVEVITVKPSGKKDLTNIYKMKQSTKRIEKTFKDITKSQKDIKEKIENVKKD